MIIIFFTVHFILSGDNLTRWIQKKANFLFVINLITWTKEHYRNGRWLNICGTMYYVLLFVSKPYFMLQHCTVCGSTWRAWLFLLKSRRLETRRRSIDCRSHETWRMPSGDYWLVCPALSTFESSTMSKCNTRFTVMYRREPKIKLYIGLSSSVGRAPD